MTGFGSFISWNTLTLDFVSNIEVSERLPQLSTALKKTRIPEARFNGNAMPLATTFIDTASSEENAMPTAGGAIA
jgi:hypothetical protein